MLYLDDSDELPYVSEITLDLAAAVEDGVMDVFFENGHIIFNAGLMNEKPAEPPFKAERLSVRIAKAGGATFLLEVGLGSAGAENLLPSRADYLFLDLISSKIISEGTIPITAIRDEDSTDMREKCILLGKRVAEIAIGQW